MSRVAEIAGSNCITALSKLSEVTAGSNAERKHRKLFPLPLFCVFFIALPLAPIDGVTVYRMSPIHRQLTFPIARVSSLSAISRVPTTPRAP